MLNVEFYCCSSSFRIEIFQSLTPNEHENLQTSLKVLRTFKIPTVLTYNFRSSAGF